MAQEIYGKGLLVKRVTDSGIVCADNGFYTLSGISAEDYEEAGIIPGCKIKGTIHMNAMNGSTFRFIADWSIGGEGKAVAETEAAKTTIRRKNATK